jgi:copper resistance protein B
VKTILSLAALLAASPLAAQHQHHDHAPAPAPTPAPVPAPDPHAGHDMAAQETDPHAGHDMSSPAPDPHAGHDMPEPAADPHAGHDMSAPEADPHAGHDMSAMDAPASSGPTEETPPPPAAGSGPPRAADAIWGAAAMAASREDLRRTHGDFPLFWFQGDRIEAQVRDGADAYLWDIQGYYGGPTERFWFKSEGEGEFGADPDDAEVQALYARAFAPFWDAQVGVRQDLAGPDTTHAVIGVQGLAPYLFEIDAALFVSHRGDVTARIEAEIDQRLTQRLILQPRIEANLAAQDIAVLGVGAGFDQIEIGARLRYEITREFAPYIGVEQSWRTGQGARFARAAGQDPSTTSLVAGIRFWF